MTGERTHSTHSDTNSNATNSNGDNNTNGNCGSGSGNVFHVVFAARRERAACGGPTDAGMGTGPNGRAGAKAAATSVDLAAGAGEEGGGAVLCLVTGEVFKLGRFEKPGKVARQRVKKGPPQRTGSWRQGNSFAPLAAQRKKTVMEKMRRKTNGNCGSGNVFHVDVSARKERAAHGGPTDAGMGTEPNGRAAMAPEPGPAGTGT